MLKRLLLLAVLPLTACQTAGSDPDLEHFLITPGHSLRQ